MLECDITSYLNRDKAHSSEEWWWCEEFVAYLKCRSLQQMSSQATRRINRQWLEMPKIDCQFVEDFVPCKWQHIQGYFPRLKGIWEALEMILADESVAASYGNKWNIWIQIEFDSLNNQWAIKINWKISLAIMMMMMMIVTDW